MAGGAKVLSRIKARGVFLLAILAIVISGLVIVYSHASTPTTSTEPESGTLSSCASQLSDSSASGGGVVKFGGCQTNGFTHPGVLLGSAQLNFVKNKLAGGQTPWTSAYTKLLGQKAQFGTNDGVYFSSLSYTPHPAAHVTCGYGAASSQPAACNDELNDAIAAYSDALMYYYDYNLSGTRDAYAQKAVQILNAWSGTLIDHPYNPPDTTTMNAPLQAAWVGSIFARTAEIIRYTYTAPGGENSLNITDLNNVFSTAFLPLVTQPHGGSNWLMSEIEASISIAVFQNDRSLFNSSVDRWRTYVPTMIYMTSDGAAPLLPPDYPYSAEAYWYNPSSFVQGQEQETCRDPAHMAMGFAGIMNVAETARLQGVDLYSEEKDRIAAGLEANANWLVAVLGSQAPSNWPCAAAMASPTSNATWKVTFEAADNEFADRLGLSMPHLTALMTYTRASSWTAAYTMLYEQLTFEGTP